ncbi:hypothetical protein MTO98_25720 [Mucilaginibacter sp. SMC90]|uniref:hypothetical protein n=1 Tax=Mucilaginibacter sp. SMC90 TaxID=2929803 RepID=UPI001FB54FCA|nr:hypothetical protein [Mucilaginibacter sp. SMC90]UOE47812.1 hypothetical protein MTO98_25720 [Mucilaginibacter sp. SMC90]
MHPLLTKLGVSGEIQDFFGISELNFHYGSSVSAEFFEEGFHYVPAADQAWIWNTNAGSHVVLTDSVMEAIAFLSCNRHRYPRLHNLAFVALGRLPGWLQLAEINARFPQRHFILVFANDLLGRLTDVYVAAALRNHVPRLFWRGDKVEIISRGRALQFEANDITLNVFQKAFGIRTCCRTIKPKRHASFLILLLQQPPQP